MCYGLAADCIFLISRDLNLLAGGVSFTCRHLEENTSISVRELDRLTRDKMVGLLSSEVAAGISSQVPPTTFESKVPMTFWESPENSVRKF